MLPEYSIRTSSRSRRMSIVVKPGGQVIVTIPKGMSADRVSAFVAMHAQWILEKAAKARKRPQLLLAHLTARDYARHKEQARTLVHGLLECCNAQYGFTIRTVRIGNQKSRWGSCSARGNLNFNYKILFVPPELQEYVIVHELCHLQQMNHSRKFWSLVEKTIPDWYVRRAALRKY